MLRDNLAGLIEPMVDRGHPKGGQTGGCSRSTEMAIVALKRSWSPIFHWKTGRRAEKGKWLGFEVTTAAHDSRAVSTAQHQSHRTIDPQCLKKSPPRRGGIFALTGNVASPFHAEPRHSLAHFKKQQSGFGRRLNSDFVYILQPPKRRQCRTTRTGVKLRNSVR
jgi:hypothetical protein